MGFDLFDLFEVSDLQSAFVLGLRILVAIGAGVVGWFLAGPLASLTHRLVFRKPISNTNLFVSRVIGAILLAVLAFLLVSIGTGWGMGGSDPGTGRTNGVQPGDGPPTPPEPKPKPPEPSPKDAVLPIEIITKQHYKDDGRFYLIDGKEPARTLQEVEKRLKESPDRWDQMNILIYSNSFHQEDVPVKQLEKLAVKYSLRTAIPPEYFTREKTIQKMEK